MTKPKLIALYREAAVRVNDKQRNYSCNAVCYLGDSEEFPDRWAARELYSRTMKLTDDAAHFIDAEPNPRTLRVLLLLMMSEWVRTDYVEVKS